MYGDATQEVLNNLKESSFTLFLNSRIWAAVPKEKMGWDTFFIFFSFSFCYFLLVLLLLYWVRIFFLSFIVDYFININIFILLGLLLFFFIFYFIYLFLFSFYFLFLFVFFFDPNKLFFYYDLTQKQIKTWMRSKMSFKFVANVLSLFPPMKLQQSLGVCLIIMDAWTVLNVRRGLPQTLASSSLAILSVCLVRYENIEPLSS